MELRNIFENAAAVTMIETVLQDKLYSIWVILQTNPAAKELTVTFKVKEFTAEVNNMMKSFLNEKAAAKLAVKEVEVMEVVCERCAAIITGSKVEYDGNINGIFKLTIEKL